MAFNDTDDSFFDDVETLDVPEVKAPAPTPTPVEIRVSKVEKVKETPVAVKVQKKEIPSVNKLAKVERPAPVSIDSFPDVRVNEGEEVLVSVSEKKNPVNLNNRVYRNPTPINTVAPTPINDDDYFDPEEDIAKVDDNPFGVSVSNISSNNSNFKKALNNSVEVSTGPSKRQSDIMFGQENNPFVKAFSTLKPEKKDKSDTSKPKSNKKEKVKEKVVASVSPKNLKRDLYHTYISDNQYLSPAEYYDDEEEFYEEAEEYDEEYAEDADFDDEKNVGDALEGNVGPVNVNKIKEKFQNIKKSSNSSGGPLKVGNHEVLQMKLDFEPNSSAISGESVNIIRSFAQIATDHPTNSIQIAISEKVMNDPNAKKLAARRLAIVSNVLRNAGISDRQINPVLTNRDADSFSFRVVSNASFDKLKVAKSYDPFGEEENVQEYNLMRW